MQNKSLRILLVDDDHNERDGLRFLIEREKYPLSIFEASNGKRALEIIREEQIDILLADIRMPYMDGLELSAIVHDEFPETKIIIFSAYGEFKYAKKAMEAKAATVNSAVQKTSNNINSAKSGWTYRSGGSN